MDKLFLVDRKREVVKTYKDFFRDLEKTEKLENIIYESSPYLIFLKLVRSIIDGLKIEMLDYDFSNEEIKRLGISEEMLSNSTKVSDIKIENFNELIYLINKSTKNWKIALYTSGTTGRPKKVYHTFESLTRNVKTGEKFKDNVWAFSYNPTHIAGIQVFFQALLNMNTIVYIFDVNRKEIPELLSNYKVTNISATPTFYRTILPEIKEKIDSVKRVTFGGEKFDPTLENDLKNVFPNAKIVNIYASTEAGTLLTSSGEYFEIPEDKREYFKISEDGELLIHKLLLGESTEINIENGWYHTGDIVEIIEGNKIRFVGRKTEMINVGGYKVNPNEVEEEIKKVNGVLDAYVYAKSNRLTGNIIVADVVIDKEQYSEKEIEKEIYEKLKNNLQSWKIPRILNFVDNLSLTRTGKKVRKWKTWR